MQVSSQFTVGCPHADVFQFVSTPERLAGCIPGCSQLTDLGDGQYAAVLEVEVAFLKLKFDVTVRLTEVNPPTSLKAVVDGKPKALAGKLSGQVELMVEPIDEQTTRIQYLLEQTMTGKLGGIGQSVFRAKCEEMGSLFAENLKAALSSQEALS
ncbi:MAG: hypothetical protein K6T31_00325 [Alicyclobacillus sp.]|nr:hypothetical protein [Alicyclobacillus sp.]